MLAWVGFLIVTAHLGDADRRRRIDDELPQSLGVDESDVALIAVAVLVCVGAPIVEELFFRGFFFTALRSWRGMWPAAIITGLVFGSIHAGSSDPAFLLPLAVFGFALCLLYVKTALALPVHRHACAQQLAGLRRLAELGLGDPAAARRLARPDRPDSRRRARGRGPRAGDGVGLDAGGGRAPDQRPARPLPRRARRIRFPADEAATGRRVSCRHRAAGRRGPRGRTPSAAPADRRSSAAAASARRPPCGSRWSVSATAPCSRAIAGSCEETVRPYAAGQTGRRPALPRRPQASLARRLKISAAPGRRPLPRRLPRERPGRLTVRASHRATAELGTAVARRLRVSVVARRASFGSRGLAVRLLQTRLARLRYVVGPARTATTSARRAR